MVDSIRNSVVIARAQISSSISQASILVAGHISAELDGDVQNTANGSLLLSRGWADIRSGHGTMVAAPEGIGGANELRLGGLTFINAPAPQAPAAFPGALAAAMGLGSSRSVKVPDLPLGPLPVHPLAGRIEMNGILHGPPTDKSPTAIRLHALAPRGIVFRFQDRVHVAELNQPIVDEDANAVEGLRGWKLACMNEKMALLVGPQANAVLRLEKK